MTGVNATNAAIAAECSTLRRRRGSIQAAITNFKTTIQTYRGTPIEDRRPYQFRAALQRLQERFRVFPEIQERLEDLDENEVDRRFELEDSFDATIGDALELLEQPKLHSSAPHSSLPAQVPTVTNHLPSRPRLPEIKVPEFSGAIEEFPTFWDSYTSVIHGNPDLAIIQQFQYLRGLLKGRASATISSLATTEENYAIAIDILKRKYDCKKKILQRHWSIMRDYPPLQRDAPTELGQLADVMNQHIQALETLGQNVSSWDLPLIDLITQKLAPETIWQWELKTQGNELPTYKQLLEFIESRATCHDVRTRTSRSLTSTSLDPTSSDRRKEKKTRRQAFVTTSLAPVQSADYGISATSAIPPSCFLQCGTGHRHLSKCPIFKSLTPEQRFTKAKTANYCINCLKPGHTSSVCTSSVDCSICKARHHTLLHKHTETTSSPTQA